MGLFSGISRNGSTAFSVSKHSFGNCWYNAVPFVFHAIISSLTCLIIFAGLPKALGYQNLVNDEKAIEGFAEKLTKVLRELSQAHQTLVAGMCSRFAEALGLDPQTPLKQLRSQSRGRCSGLENYTLDAKGVRGLLVRIGRDDASDDQWFENILMFLGSKPSQKWTDADKDEADYKLAQLSRRLTELFKLAAEERRFAEHADGDFDVYLLKSLRKGSDFIDEVVTVDKAKEKHAKSIRESLEAALPKSSDRALQELQLVALAQVVDEFLVNKRESEKGQKDQDSPTNNNQTEELG